MICCTIARALRKELIFGGGGVPISRCSQGQGTITDKGGVDRWDIFFSPKSPNPLQLGTALCSTSQQSYFRAILL